MTVGDVTLARPDVQPPRIDHKKGAGLLRRPAPRDCFGVCGYQSWLAGQPPVLAGEQVRVIAPLFFTIVN